MKHPHFNPYFALRRFAWRNRIARWRHAPGETLFHAAIWSALLMLAGFALHALSARRDLADALFALMQSAPWAWLLAWGGLIAMQVRLSSQDWQQRDARGWLATLPVAARMRAREHLRRLLCTATPHWIAAIWLAVYLRLPWEARGWLAVMLAMATATGALWSRRQRKQATRQRPKSRAFADVPLPSQAGRGCLWRWQVRASLVGFGPRALRQGLWMLLLIPVGTSAFAAAMALAAGLALAASIAAWRHCLDVLVQAERWLGPQPSPPRFWLYGMVVPMTLASTGAAATGLTLAALGAARMAPWLALALVALALLQVACALAWRRTPSRTVLSTTLHVTLLGAAWQAFPPLAAVLWVLMCLRLLKRGVTP
ncbi:hypothetical protein OS176_00220 [Xanthomonadaceae bacterium XH05]|nr:hypothetical protein [Xanthomonadaceae bacterium XH05]